jgi:hypothetical protein
VVAHEGRVWVAPALLVAREELWGVTLVDGSVLFCGGRGADGLPSSATDLLLPAGVSAQDAGDVFADARAEKAAWDHTTAERDAAVAEGLRLKADLDRTLAELAVARGERQRLETEVKAAEKKVADLEARVATLKGELLRSQMQTQMLKDRLAAAENALVDALRSEGDLRGRLAASATSASDLEREVADLRAKVAAAKAKAEAETPRVMIGSPKRGRTVGLVLSYPPERKKGRR